MTSVLWFRRDLRLHDHPALQEAIGRGPVLPVFIVEPALWDGAGAVRRGWLAANVLALHESLQGGLCVRFGDPALVLADLVRDHGAESVHHTRETTPWAVRRDRRIGAALGDDDVEIVATGTPYAVGPGLVTRGNGEQYKVFTPFSRAWRDRGWPSPAPAPDDVQLTRADDDRGTISRLQKAVRECPVPLPDAGEQAALRRWAQFLDSIVDGYDHDRDRPDLDGTSRMSPYLKVGAVHPRTLLDGLRRRRSNSAERLRTELAWREFYADVLWRHPRSAWHDMRDGMHGLYDREPDDHLTRAWQAGRTGFPLVDAGMRQLNETGWMHNRVRMVTASFLTKDLHQWWGHGARYFLEHLIDGDLASNNHGWQWVAGTGTDAAPFHRVFNPVRQAERFDPHGDYVRRWIPELRHLSAAAVHTPWDQPDGYAHDYPQRIIDHAVERRDALERYDHVRAEQRPAP